MSDADGAVADSGSMASNEPVIASTPNPISTEPQAQPDAGAKEPKEDAKAEPKEAAKPVTARDALRRAAEKVEKDGVEASKTPPVKSDPKPDGKSQAKAEEGKGQPRSDDGKFAGKEGDKALREAPKPAAEAKLASEQQPAGDQSKTAEAAKDAKPNLPSYTASEPPKRFSPDAKEAWASAPDAVRAEVSRMERELTQGFEKHRAAAERDASIAEYHEMAQKGGTTVKEALSKYVGMENQLRADPIKGFELICQNAGLSFREVAARYLNQTPEQSAVKADATVRELRAEIAELKKQVGGVTETMQSQRTQTTQESVAKFAAENPRFEELSDDIAFFLKSGRTQDLAEAYSLAERLNPAPAKPAAEVPAKASTAAVAEVAKATPDLSAQTERGSKSIAGSPTPGSNPVTRRPSTSIRESLRRAQAAAG